MKVMKCLLSLALVAVLAGGAVDEKKGEKSDAKKPTAKKVEAKKGKPAAKKGDRAKGRKKRSILAQFVNGIELSGEQKEKLAALEKEIGPKFAELQKQNASILTDEQKKAQQEIFASARKDKTNRAEVAKKIAAAIQLTDEQKAKRTEIRKAMGQLRQDAIAKISTFLTEEQKAKLPKRGNRKAGAKKPGAKKAGDKKPAKLGDKKPAEKKPSKDAA